MSDAPKKSGLFIAIAALAMGVIAGAITVYWTAGQSGNGQEETNIAQAAAACTMTDATKASMDAAAIGDLAAMRIAKKPIPLAHIGFKLPNDEDITFGDWKDKVVLLNIWATWCGPCREEMPDLAKLQEEYGGDTFEVLALNVDRNGGVKPQQFLESIKATALGLYLDPKNKTFQDLRSKGLVFGLPTTMILDAHGCVQGVLSGIAHWNSDDARNLIEVSIKELGAKT
ncbi:MAG: TlpA disulfide reductase family protein [Hyphomicrobiales bacterium]